jgi:lysyl-tRNA synthetase class 2
MADKQPTAGDAAVDAAAAAVSKLHLDEVTGEMISKTELKKRQKAREKEAQKKEKDAANKDKKPAQAAGKKASAEASEKELTPNQVRLCASTLSRDH